MGVTGAPPAVRLTKSLRPTARRFFGLIPRGLEEGLRGEEVAKIIYSRLYTCMHGYEDNMGLFCEISVSLGKRQKWRSGERAPTATGPRSFHHGGLILVTVLRHG